MVCTLLLLFIFYSSKSIVLCGECEGGRCIDGDDRYFRFIGYDRERSVVVSVSSNCAENNRAVASFGRIMVGRSVCVGYHSVLSYRVEIGQL